MSPTIAEVAEAFSRHDFAATYPHLAEDVRWDVVGDRRIAGRDAVVGACEDSAAHLRSVTTTFSAFRVLPGADFVVTESTAEYADADGATSTIRSCDVYRFAGRELAEITSYTVEVR